MKYWMHCICNQQIGTCRGKAPPSCYARPFCPPTSAKDKDTLALLQWLDESQQADKLFENQQLIRQPIVRNGRLATVGYCPDVWGKWA